MRITPLQVATLAIASVFVARAAVRMVQPEFNILRFAVLGWPPWMVWAISAAELVGAALLLWGATFRVGALLLAVVAAAFLVTYARIGVPEAGLGSGGLLIALAGLALLRR
jgi:uncharacterized membrane protein YphA (DoxX/SURF4 family)